MDREELRRLLNQGLSLEQIGQRHGKHASTVGYWVKKHGLRAVNADRHAPKGTVPLEQLLPLVEDGASLRQIGEELGLSATAVRHWVKKYGLKTRRTRRLAESARARAEGARSVTLTCLHHGETEFRLSARGGFRCARCTSEAVSRRRRRVKQILIEEAGGACLICGYDTYPGALHFHHLVPAEKAFMVSRSGQTRSIAEVREEARKCVLLCSNCHAEVEAGIVSLDSVGDEAAGASVHPK